MDAETRRVLFEQALTAARRKGVPDEELEKAEGIADVYEMMREHSEKKRQATLDEHRKAKGLPSMRDRDAHKE